MSQVAPLRVSFSRLIDVVSHHGEHNKLRRLVSGVNSLCPIRTLSATARRSGAAGVPATLQALEIISSIGYNPAMATTPVSEQLRRAIEQSDKTRYRISLETGIDQATLSRFVNDSSIGMTLPNIDKLCECIGVELVAKSERAKRKPTTKNSKRK